MNDATLLTANLTTHVKIVAIAVAATIVVCLVEFGTQTRSPGSEPLSQTAGLSIRPGS